MLKINNLSKKYQKSKFELKEFSCEIPDCSLTFVLGKSGSGKSTLLNIISGLDKNFSGSFEFFNETFSANSSLDDYRRKYVGNVFQDFKLINSLNVYDNIVSSARANNIAVDENEIIDIASKLGILKLLKRSVRHLSGGEKQRVAIARCLAKKPKIILCDEPTGSLDSKNAEIVFELLKEISNSKTVIVISHNENAAEKYADKIIHITDGAVTDGPCTISKKQKSIVMDEPVIKKTSNKKSLVKMGLKAFAASPLRTFVELLVFVASLTALNFFSCSDSPDKKVRLEALYQKNINHICLAKVDHYEKESQYFGYESVFDEEDVSLLKKKIENQDIDTAYERFVNFEENYTDCYDENFFDIDGNIKINNAFIQKYQLNFSCGRMPENNSEVVITEYLANNLINYGLKTAQSENVNEGNDLIGKTIKMFDIKESKNTSFFISGIIGVPFMYENSEQFKHFDISCSLNNFIYFYENNSIFDADHAKNILLPITGNLDSDNKLCEKIEKMTFDSKANENSEYYVNSTISIANGTFTEFKNLTQNNKLSKIFNIVMKIVFFFLSIGVSFYFYSYLLAQKNGEIETLNLVGYKKRDILLIYFIHSFVNSLLISLLSFLFGALANATYYVITFEKLQLAMALRPFPLVGLLSIILLPIICNLTFTAIFANVDTTKKYK